MAPLLHASCCFLLHILENLSNRAEKKALLAPAVDWQAMPDQHSLPEESPALAFP